MSQPPNTLDPATLTKAVMRAAERLELLDALPAALGLTADEVHELRDGRMHLDPSRGAWHCRRLAQIAQARRWFAP